jgi:hypothetical protein
MIRPSEFFLKFLSVDRDEREREREMRDERVVW